MALTEADDSLSVQASDFRDVQGCVLYVVDVPVSD